MIKLLRRKFVLVTMVLVGLVLIGVLGSTYASSYQSFHSMLDNSLYRALGYSDTSRPSIGSGGTGTDPSLDDKVGGGHMVVFWVDVDDEGIVLHSNVSSVSISDEALGEVLSEAITSDADAGEIKEYQLAWKRATTTTGVRVAVADTSGIDASLRSQAIRDLLITGVSLGALFAIIWLLSGWILRPVERSWDQQRRFVADASHELKTPLSVIIANTQILSEKADELPADDARWLKGTAEEAERMKGLVSDLLELARTDESSVGTAGAFQSVPVDMSSLVENVSLEFDAIAFERGCEVDSTVKEGLTVTGDPAALERLVRILVDNACKYARADSTVEVVLAQDGSRCRLSVTNQGTPIDPVDLPHVFDRFYRSDKSRTREDGQETGGYGLGLAIAKGIVSAHHGTISCTSTEKTGTCFTALI